MLADAQVQAFLATTDVPRARAFFDGVLGLRLLSEDPFAFVFDANGTPLRVAFVESLTPQPFTVLGWQVDDLVAAVKALSARGVHFERYPGMEQDELGIWNVARVAWFKDPDGNTLSLSQSSL
jgi:catechol 2,3-dioxygenase-like lactoylglutathione lyase family enzyme